MIYFVLNIFHENRVVCEITWKNTIEGDKPHMTTQHGACALHVK